jgi:O-antigen ligase
VLLLVGTALSVAALVFSASPGGWHRISQVESDQPRSELWLVAWRMSQDHPLIGVGLNNFSGEAGNYVRRPGTLRNVELIADRPLLAHNSFLEVQADTGLIGLVMYVGFSLSCLGAALAAARRFEARAERSLAELSRATAVAIIAMLSASVFLSIATDERTWLLLALGPTLLGIASRGGRDAAPAPSGERSPTAVAPAWPPSTSTP